MTYATDRGFKVGKHYRIIVDDTPAHDPQYYTKGMIVELAEDDGSKLPYVRCVHGNAKYMKPGTLFCIHIDKLEPLDEHEEVLDNAFLLKEYIRINYPEDAFLRILIENLKGN